MNPSDYLDLLAKSRHLCFLKKKENPRSVSVAISALGKQYVCGNIESYNHMLDITSEHAVLILAMNSGDPYIKEVITLLDTEGAIGQSRLQVNPLIIKVLVDHYIRTGTKIAYSVYSREGKKLIDIPDVWNYLPGYQPEMLDLDFIKSQKPASDKVEYQGEPLEKILKECAIRGMDRAMLAANQGTRYGAAVLTDKGNIYFAGQYGSFEHRLNVHAEMAAFVCALANDDRNITHLGLVSDKFRDEPVSACGCCRQFYSEIIQRTGRDIEYFLFALDTDEFSTYSQEEYLPGKWSSIKAKK